MAIAHVQSKPNATTGAAGNTSNITLDSSTTTGNLLVVAVSSYGPTQTVSSLTDNKGNTFTRIGTVNRSPGSDTLDFFYAKNITGGAAHQLSVTMANTENIGITVSEYSGAHTSTPLDVSNTTANGTGTTGTSGSITPSANNCLIYAAGTDQLLEGTSVTPDSGYTFRTMEGTADDSVRIYSEDKVLPTAAATTAAFTIGDAVTWAVVIAAFKEATASPPTGLPAGTLMMMGCGV